MPFTKTIKTPYIKSGGRNNDHKRNISRMKSRMERSNHNNRR